MSEEKKKLHMIGNAHIDPVWLWQWHEGYHEAIATFHSALDRLREYKDFIFISSSAAIYEWVEENDPTMFAEIQQRVAEGRWGIVGGWWIEPDCNIPCGESFVRQGLYGQRYFRKKFGITARVGYAIDSFGHNGMLPQILKKSGMPYYVFMRPGPHEKDLPGRLFWWESDDGSRIITYQIPFSYGTWGNELSQHISNIASELNHPINDLMCFFGVGNHGGGPTIENIESIYALRKDPSFPSLEFSTPERFFANLLPISDTLPIVHDDLQHHASGCYSAHSGVKRWNRLAENRLLAAEKFSVLANIYTGHAYPNDFTRAWKNVLFNQFHDIMAGTSLEIAYEDARNQFGEALSIADRAINKAVQSIIWNIQIDPDLEMTPIVVFNPHSWEVKTCAELETSRIAEEEFILLDDHDQEVAYQLTQPQSTTGWRNRIVFIANLPSLGYRVYRLVKRTSKINIAQVKENTPLLENSRLRIEFDPISGFIKSLFDKINGVEILAGDGAVPVVIEDNSDTWSHNVFSFNKVIGQFSVSKIEMIEHGPVKSIVRVISLYNASSLIQDYIMYNDIDLIDVNVKVDWHEQHKMLKLRFPINLDQVKATYEIPYGYIERITNGEEEPGQSWIDVSGISRNSSKKYGLSILNDGKYSFDVDNNNIGLTILRSPIFAHHHPHVPEPERLYTYIDQGVQQFQYSLLPHIGSWEEAGTVKRAAEMNQRPIAIITTFHTGQLDQSRSFINVNQENLIVSVIKKAEDNDDIVLRCFETAGITTQGEIKIPSLQRIISAKFGPCEIKTFRIPTVKDQPVIETNLLEWIDQ